ncbi:MAG: hypothetical protein AAF202_08105, partial [Pseudomonadota bacterium]
MIRVLVFIVAFLSFSAQGEFAPCETETKDLIGHWKYDRYRYQGQEHPRPNPRLKLYIQFFETGTNRVWWERTNEQGFCERIGSFTYNSDQCTFSDTVEWVNPGNNSECGSDPDMKLGRTATSRLVHESGALH